MPARPPPRSHPSDATGTDDAGTDAGPAAPGTRLLRLWRRLSPLPGGRTVFSWLLGRTVPYSGTLGARVLALEPGRAEVRLDERRRVRNHLRSVHAVALTNLGELATGLAVVTALPPGVRGIVTSLTSEYHQKARGRLRAVAAWQPPSMLALPAEARVSTEITDATGRTVATVSTVWRLGAQAPDS